MTRYLCIAVLPADPEAVARPGLRAAHERAHREQRAGHAPPPPVGHAHLPHHSLTQQLTREGGTNY